MRNKTFVDSIAMRQLTIVQRARIAEARCLIALPAADSAVTVTAAEVDSLTRQFRSVSVNAAGSYLLDRSLDPSALTQAHAAVQPRVGSEDTPWMLLVCLPSGTSAAQLSLHSADGTTLATVAAPEASPDFGTGSGTTLVLGPEEAGPIATAIANNPKARYTLRAGSLSIVITPATATAIVRSAALADARARHRQALIDHEAIDRRLVTARNQIANGGPTGQ